MKLGEIGTRIPFGCPGRGRPRVLVSLFCGDAILHKKVAQAALQIALEETGRGRLSGDIIMPTLRPFENALHHVMADIRRHDYTHWLSMDDDNPPLLNPLDLVERDLDLVGFPTPVWHWRGDEPRGERPVYWNAYKYVQEHDAYAEYHPREGLQRVDAIGTGCFLMSRRVVDHPAWIETAAFARTTTPDGRVIKGNDIAFCERARGLGFEIYASFDHPCDHHVPVSLNEAVAAFRRLYERE